MAVQVETDILEWMGDEKEMAVAISMAQRKETTGENPVCILISVSLTLIVSKFLTPSVLIYENGIVDAHMSIRCIWLQLKENSILTDRHKDGNLLVPGQVTKSGIGGALYFWLDSGV